MSNRERFREPWFQRHEAVVLVRQYLQCSIGKAEATIDRAVACGEVRTEAAAIEDFTCKTGSRVKAITKYSGDDLLAWLKPQIPQESQKSKKAVQHHYRYPGDARLVEQGQQLVAKGMKKRAAARELAPRAVGGTLDQRIERLRKLF